MDVGEFEAPLHNQSSSCRQRVITMFVVNVGNLHPFLNDGSLKNQIFADFENLQWPILKVF